MGFNEGHFDELKLEEVPDRLGHLARSVRTSELTLSSPRNQWSESVKKWLAERDETWPVPKKGDEQAI